MSSQVSSRQVGSGMPRVLVAIRVTRGAEGSDATWHTRASDTVAYAEGPTAGLAASMLQGMHRGLLRVCCEGAASVLWAMLENGLARRATTNPRAIGAAFENVEACCSVAPCSRGHY